MGFEEVLVQVPGATQAPRVGKVVGVVSPKQLSILWDGATSPEVVTLGSGYRKTFRGSVVCEALANPEGLATSFAEDPEPWFYAALAEHDFKAKTFAAMAQLFDGAPISQDSLASAWKACFKSLAKRDDVKVSAATPTEKSEYKRLRDNAPKTKSATSSDGLEPGLEVEATPNHGAPEAPPAPAAEKQGVSPQLTIHDRLNDLLESAPHETGLYAFFQSCLDDNDFVAKKGQVNVKTASDLFALLEDILRLSTDDRSTILGLMSEAQRTELVPVLMLDGELAPFVPVLEGQKFAKSARFPQMLISMLDDLTRSSSQFTQARVAALFQFASHGLKLRTQPLDKPQVLLLIADLASRHAPWLVAFFIRSLSDSLSRSTALSLSESELETTARLLAELPVEERSGRLEVLGEIARLSPKVLSQELWWTGISWAEFGTIGRSSYAELLDFPSVQGQIIQPRLTQFVRSLTRRSDLALLVGLPDSVLSLVDIDVVPNLVERVGKDDPLFASWLGVISGKSELAELRTLVEESSVTIASHVSASELLQSQLREVREELALAQDSLRNLQTAAREAAESTMRQEKLKGLRAAIDAAVLIEQKEGSASGALEMIRHQLERNNIYSFGIVGRVEAFNPTRHRAPGQRPQDGEDVIVGVSGYEYRMTDGELVLEPALVAKAT